MDAYAILIQKTHRRKAEEIDAEILSILCSGPSTRASIARSICLGSGSRSVSAALDRLIHNGHIKKSRKRIGKTTYAVYYLSSKSPGEMLCDVWRTDTYFAKQQGI